MEPSASPASRRRIPGLPHPVLAAAQQKWLFTDEELERTPSRMDKIERGKEDYIRHRAVEFIWQASMMLKMPPQTSMTATVYMHRFLMRYSLLGQDPAASGLMHPKVIAAVALFVAFKVDETVRRMKDFVIACCRVALKQPDMIIDEQSKDYWKWRDLILQNESVMLEFLCFDLQIESPYRILWDYALFLNVHDNRPLRHAAYAFLNDSTYTVLCLQFPSRVIAAAALYAAARHCHVAFPDDDEGRPWWEQIDVRLEDLIRACKFIVKIYERVQQNLSKGYPDFALSDTLPEDPTRLLPSGSNPEARQTLSASNAPSLATPESVTPNGRKRSREPDLPPSAAQVPNQPQQQPSPSKALNGERSPKRQRTVSPGPNATVPTPEPSGSRPRIPLKAMESSAQPTPTKDQKLPDLSENEKEKSSAEEGEIPEETPADSTTASVSASAPVPTASDTVEQGKPEPEKGKTLTETGTENDQDEGAGSEEGEI
ncbi:hypothetical protein NUU61_004890 [Penicillium alfredii]|uniref:RNA polymerase II holoenzyme cyclin-like subunit n=1 Tax=Penicillium alfredii TaxID=1506179 RepID=A0A9W9K738_9EURO|nr:uncharacterized protein NUU61_004890 [Penicillium alfredii]KAJ5095534.1 hypothetical protein NUU61_004890 [Penicillium alfredii]